MHRNSLTPPGNNVSINIWRTRTKIIISISINYIFPRVEERREGGGERGSECVNYILGGLRKQGGGNTVHTSARELIWKVRLASISLLRRGNCD